MGVLILVILWFWSCILISKLENKYDSGYKKPLNITREEFNKITRDAKKEN